MTIDDPALPDPPVHSPPEDGIDSIGDERIEEIGEALDREDRQFVETTITDLSVSEAAEILSKVDPDHRQTLLREYGHLFDPDVFPELDTELMHKALSAMSPARVAAILSELENDDALYLIEDLDPDFQKAIIKKLSYKDRIALEEGLGFPEDSAGRLMSREFVAIPQFWTVGKTIDYLRAADEELPDEFFDIFVIDPAYHIVGEIPLYNLVRSRRSEKIEALTLEATHPIPALMDQEEVAHIFRREHLTSAPVVDDSGRLIGVVTIDDVVSVIDEEAHEDILKLGGVEQGDFYRAIWSTTGSRFRWLFVNLLTAILASWVVSFFQSTIEQAVALAVLMPIVASMGGNAGTQALTVAVRALATRELSDANAVRVIWKEALVGFLNGAAFAIIMGCIAALWFSSPMLGVVIAAAMVINLIVAGLCGAGIPVILERFGSDPAVSSSVILTTFTDVVGFFAFLGLAAAFLI